MNPDPATSRRLAALARYEILDTDSEPGFDDLVAIAAHVCSTPVALVSLVARERQWFKAKIGIDACETPIGSSVCAYVLGQTELLVIPDLMLDDRTKDNPLVAGEPRIRFYAGAPLTTPQGVAIGALCVIDVKPRPEGLNDVQRSVLEKLARQAVVQMELRMMVRAQADIAAVERGAYESSQARAEATEREMVALRERSERSRIAEEAGRIGTFEIEIATNTLFASAEFCRIFGSPVGDSFEASVFEKLIVFDDRGAGSNPQTRRDGSAAPDVVYRIRRASDGQMRWIERRAEFLRDTSGGVVSMIGTAHDVTDLKRLQKQQEALLELGDRLREAANVSVAVVAVAEILGRTLAVSRTGYAHIDMKSDRFTVERDWTAPGVLSLRGGRSLAPFGKTIDRLSQGQLVVVSNIPAADWLGEDRAAYARIGVDAQINVPLMQRDALVGVLYVHQQGPRTWSDDEAHFAQGVADRAYAAIAKLEAEANQTVLNQELSHRLKNTLTMVQAIAGQTLKGAADREAVKAFENRILALSAAHDVLLKQSWTAARIHAVVEAVLKTFADLDRFRIVGPDLALGPRATLSMSLLFHELATNALKYGALSQDAGHVSVTWRVDGLEADAVVALEWREVGGPPVSAPERSGFGSKLIRMGLIGTGGVEAHYDPRGLVVGFSAPLAQLQRV